MQDFSLSAIALLAAAVLLAGCVSGPPPVAEQLDAGDRALLADTAQATLEHGKLGESANWQNPATGHRGTVTPLRTIEAADEPPCRDYQLTATVADNTAIGYDTACRRADGVWVSKYYSDPVDALRNGYPDRWRRDPYYDDMWCRWPPRSYDPWCRPRTGVTFGVGTRF